MFINISIIYNNYVYSLSVESKINCVIRTFLKFWYVMSMIYNYNRQLTAGYDFLKYFRFLKKRENMTRIFNYEVIYFPFIINS